MRRFVLNLVLHRVLLLDYAMGINMFMIDLDLCVFSHPPSLVLKVVYFEFTF